jgi:competence protein ComEC
VIKDFRLLPASICVWVAALVLVLGAPSLKQFGVVLLGIVLLAAALGCKLFSAKIVSQLVFCVVAIVILIGSFQVQAHIFSDSLVGKTDEPQLVRITSEPSIQDSFGRVRCSYQANAYNPKAFLTLTTLTDPECSLKYGASYYVDGKYSEDDFHIKNAATLEAETFELYKPASTIDDFYNDLRAKFLRLAKTLPGNAPGLVPGMSVGDTRYMEKGVKDATKVSGLTHLTAISGAHFVIIISLIGTILSALKLRLSVKVILQLIAIVAMVLLVHPTDSVKRAAVMSVIGLCGIFFKRRSQSLSALFFAIIAYLIYDPYLSASFGFALSCSATASIVVFSAPLSRALEGYIGKVPAEILSVPIVAQMGCYPVLLLMTDYITPYAPVANVLVIPAIEPATILSLLSCLLSGVWPWLALLLARAAGFCTEIIASVATHMSNLPGAKVAWPTGLRGALILYAILTLIIIIPQLYKFAYKRISKRNLPEYNSLKGKLTRGRKVAHDILVNKLYKAHRVQFLSIFLVVVILASSTIYVRSELGWFTSIPKNWLIVACNVGQGDAALIRTGSTSAIMVDAGPGDTSTGGEPAANCLKRAGVKVVDAFVVSHYHDDHIAGLDQVLDTAIFKKALLNPVKSPMRNHQHLVKLFEEKSIPIEYANDQMRNVGECEERGQFCAKYDILSIWDNLGKGGEVVETVPKGDSTLEDDRENDSSLAMLFDINGVRYFTAGDLEQKGASAALKALQKEGVQNVDVMKVNHHGSKTQNAALVKLLHPMVSIYMSGENTYGHPAKDTLKLTSDEGLVNLRVDESGLCGVYLGQDGELHIFENG